MADNAAVDEFNAMMAKAGKMTQKGNGEDSRGGKFDTSELHLSDSEEEERASKNIRSGARKNNNNTQRASSRPGVNYILPSKSFSGNTGVKGVITDAIAFDNARQQERGLRKNEGGLSSLSLNKGQAEREGLMKNRRHEPDSHDHGSDSELDVDEDFISSWMNARLKSVINYPAEAPSSRSKTTGLVAVTADTYLTIVDSSSPHLTVVVLIHDPDNDASVDIAEALDEIALGVVGRQRFIMLGHEEAEMSEGSVPTIITYRNGEMVENLVRVHDMLETSKGQGSLTMRLASLLKS